MIREACYLESFLAKTIILSVEVRNCMQERIWGMIFWLETIKATGIFSAIENNVPLQRLLVINKN
jgi:hypothetical protein